jgi:hypothetical protein
MNTQPEELTAAVVQTYVDRASETLHKQFNTLLSLISPVVNFAYAAAASNDKLRQKIECRRGDLLLAIVSPGKLYEFVTGTSSGLHIEAQFNDDGKPVLYMSNTPLVPGFGYPRGEITQQQAIEMVAFMAALYEMS